MNDGRGNGARLVIGYFSIRGVPHQLLKAWMVADERQVGVAESPGAVAGGLVQWWEESTTDGEMDDGRGSGVRLVIGYFSIRGILHQLSEARMVADERQVEVAESPDAVAGGLVQ